eukprot:tig00000850_g4802.t1
MASFDVDVYRQALQNVFRLRSDPYSLFNLREDSTTRELKDAYNRLALVTHPDKNLEPGANEAFAVVKELYARLRKEYALRKGARPEPSERSDKWWEMHSWYQGLSKQADWKECGSSSGSNPSEDESLEGGPQRRRKRRRRGGTGSDSEPGSDPEEEAANEDEQSERRGGGAGRSAPRGESASKASASPSQRTPPKGDPRIPVPLQPELADQGPGYLSICWGLPGGTREPSRWLYAVFVNGRMAVDKGPTAACVLRGLVPGATYRFEVACVDGKGLLPPLPGTRSPPLIAGVPSGPPSVPTAVRVELRSRNSLKILWNISPNAQPVTLYEVRIDGVVFRSRDPAGPGFTALGLEAGTDYEVEVRATNASGASQWSKPVTLRTLDPSDSCSQ